MFENGISVLKAIKSLAKGNAFRRVVAARPDIGNFPARAAGPFRPPIGDAMNTMTDILRRMRLSKSGQTLSEHDADSKGADDCY
jgi:hypothetical protein